MLKSNRTKRNVLHQIQCRQHSKKLVLFGPITANIKFNISQKSINSRVEMLNDLCPRNTTSVCWKHDAISECNRTCTPHICGTSMQPLHGTDLAVSCKIELYGDLSEWSIMLLSLVQFPEPHVYMYKLYGLNYNVAISLNVWWPLLRGPPHKTTVWTYLCVSIGVDGWVVKCGKTPTSNKYRYNYIL